MRRRRGIRSWAELARRCGLHQNALSALASGKVRLGEMRFGTLVKLCGALNVSLDELVEMAPLRAALHPRADRSIRQEEFAEAVAAVLAVPPPSGWVGPSEEDLAEAEPATVADLAARWRGEDTFERRFGLR